MDVPLNFNRQSNARFELDGSEGTFAVSQILEQLTGFLQRQYPVFVFVVACCLLLGLAYLFTTPSSYTSHAMLLIDSSKLRVLQQQTPIADVPIDTAHVETQVEILKSENIGLSVVKSLKLAGDPEFSGRGGGLIGAILGYFVSSKEQSELRQRHDALATFLKQRYIKRVGLTYVLDISFTSLNPRRAAEIANAIADAYIVDQLEAKYQATRRASVWLQDRIKELRQQASDADRAVLDYKEKNKIVAIGGSSTGSPRLLGEQQLEELNTQLGAARAAAEEAKARLERINDVMQRDVPDATVADSLHSEVINRLRNQYLDIAAKEAIWSARYGSGHLAAVNLRTQMTELRRSIIDELGRIAQSYKSDYEISKSRVEGLERELQKLVASSQVTNRDRLGLSDLESTAKVYHSIYDSFLQRYMEAIQQQSFPITEARVISAAEPPLHKSGPVAAIVLGIACAAGLIMSSLVAIAREAIDRVFRSTREVESLLKLKCLAALPVLVSDLGDGSPIKALLPGVTKRNKELASNDLRNAATLQMHPIRARSADGGSGGTDIEGLRQPGVQPRKISGQGFTRYVIDEPLSPFAEALRSVKVIVDIGGSIRANKVIGITSTLPNEGKSTVAANFAELIADAGKKIILLDADLRNPSLTRSLAGAAKTGLLDVLAGKAQLSDAIYHDDKTGLAFLPSVLDLPLVHSNEILTSDAFRNLVNDLRKLYDYIIVDFPPIAPVVDARAATHIIDSFIFVIEWGSTRKSLVQHQLASNPELHEKILGVVLNKADIKVLHRYEAAYGGHYHQKYGYHGAYAHSTDRSRSRNG